MKRLILLALTAGSVASHAYELPFETAADRKPALRTSGDCFIRAGRILTVTKGVIKDGQILVRNGKIVAVGTNLTVPMGVPVIDARDQVVMPGIVDAHVHRGIDSTNEGAEAISAEVRIADVLDSDSLTWWQALASGETSGLALHGSANPIGGQSVVIKFKYQRPVKEAIFPGAPRMIKFALGENVTRMNGGGNPTGPGRFPATRMGVEAVYRRAFNDARAYMATWDAWNKSDRKTAPPRKDLRLDTLADILNRKIWVACHSYRADEIAMMARLSKEFGFKIATMQHALEAYKVAPDLARMGVPVSMFMDMWSFKLEGYDSIPAGPVICAKAGVLTSINTDGVSGTTALIFDAAKLVREGLTPDEALRTVTINPATQLGINQRVGSIEVGKDADLAFYDGHPFNVTSKNTLTMVDGEVLFARRDAFKVGASPDRSLDLQTISGPALLPLPQPSRSYLLTGGTVYPVSGPPIVNGEVLLNNGKIAYVGPANPRNRASGTVVVNIKGKRLYPGLIDGGGAYGLSEIAGIRQMQDLTEAGDFQPDLIAATAVQNASAHFGPVLCNGLLTVATRPAGGLIPGQAALLRSWAWSSESMTINKRLAMQFNIPTAFRTGGFAGPGGACACFGMTLKDVLDGMTQEQWDRENDPNHVHEEEEEVGPMMQDRQRPPRPDAAELTGRLKVLDDYLASVKTYMESRRTKPATTRIDLRMEAMIPVLQGKELVFMRTRSVASIRSAIALSSKYKLKGILVGANEAWRIAPEVKKSGLPVLINPAGAVDLSANDVSQPYDPYDTPYVVPALLQRAGIKFAFQSDDNAMSMNLPSKVGMSTAYGLSNAQALRALTLSSAEILGCASELGSLDVGKRATLIVTEGDALGATSRVQLAFIDGRPVELKSKHTLLRDTYMKRLDPSEALFPVN